MALDDEDRSAIAGMIADAIKGSKPPAGPAGREVPQGDWDRMSTDERRSWVRREVEEHISSLDAEAERQHLVARNKELETALAEQKKGKTARGPAKAAPAGTGAPEGEQRPTVVSKAYSFLFGSPTQ